MTTDIHDLTWPVSRLGEGIEELARKAGFDSMSGKIPAVPETVCDAGERELGRWLQWASARLNLEAEPVETAASEIEFLLRNCGPSLLQCETGREIRIWLVLKARRGLLHVIGPDLRVHRCAVETVRASLCIDLEIPIAAEVDALLDMAGVPPRRRRRTRAAILRERLSTRRIGGCWLLRLPPTASFWRQLARARLPRRALGILGVFILIYAIEIAGWSLIGQGALLGRLDVGWLTAWALLVISLIPLQLLGSWLESTFSLDTGRILKQRLLAGALRMDLDLVSHQGAGQLLGRVIESQALESLALNGGLAVLIAVVELVFASWILASGAGGGFHLALLLGWLVIAIGLSGVYWRRLHHWTAARLSMTNDLVERMVGHRTCLAQESTKRRGALEDCAIESFVDSSKAMDRSLIPVTAIIPRGWLILALVGLAPAFVSGSGSPLGLAIGLGGTLLAGRALSGISGGLASLARAGIAWTQVAPLFHAAEGSDSTTPFLSSAELASTDSADSSPVLVDASELVFRYRSQGPAVLRGATVAILNGQRILLQGPSGGGKSTLSALLVGLRSPESGLLLLNGLDRHTLGDEWHRLSTAAPQFHENHVFTGSLAFNLLMGRAWPPADQDLLEAEELCLELGLGDLLDRMPAGLMQMVGETGWQLSHGERSRVFLGRALLQNAKLTVLDESFAALDPENMERCLNCAVNRATTLVVIAHP
jgi:ATP-binding cassette, subfamily B, bacterial